MPIVYDCRFLDEGGYVELFLTDLSETLDRLNYVLLIVELNAYGGDRKSFRCCFFFAFTLKTESKEPKPTN